MAVSTHNPYEITIQSQNTNPPANIKNCTKLTKQTAHLTLRCVVVTCYFRHLKQVFEKAGIEVTPENKKELDAVIHGIVGVNYKNCPAAWKQVKSLISEDEATFVSKLKAAWENRENAS
jgi:hypothetical protein